MILFCINGEGVYLYLLASWANCFSTLLVNAFLRHMHDACSGFLLLVVSVCAMFWALAVVCEDYFVPALNILCEELNVSNDVAGATFMAAGASSPELFTAFIALFVNHSAIGVGTVVGSEIFNHMIISAGSVMYAEGGMLQLDKWVFTRDVLAYLAALVTLVHSLKGSFFPALARMFNPGESQQCLYVTMDHSAALLIMYFFYVLVCAYFKRFRRWMSADEFCENVDREASIAEEATAVLARAPEAVENGQSDAIANNAGSPPVRSESPVNPMHAGAGTELDIRDTFASVGASNSGVAKRHHQHRWRSSAVGSLGPASSAITVHQDTLFPHMNLMKAFLRNYVAGVMNADMAVVEESAVSVSGYMYTQGTKYVRPWQCCADVGGNSRWRLRYFTIDENGFHSRKQKTSAKTGPHIRLMNMHDIDRVEILDASTGRFMLVLKDYAGKDRQQHGASKEKDQEGGSLEGANIELKGIGSADSAVSAVDENLREIDAKAQPTLIYIAPGVKSLELFVASLKREIEKEKLMSVRASTLLYRQRESRLSGPEIEHRSPDHILHGPVPDGVDPMIHLFESLSHRLLYPLKFFFYYTIPDVALEGNRNRYHWSIASSVVWLAILSFTMIECCDALGLWIGANPLVMGLTLSAVGTSFPNLYASMLVARQGQGNMAISNAMGSNVFNICAALGLPWFMYICINDGKSYSDMTDDGIVFMLFLLIVVLFVYYIVIMMHNYQVQKWMASYYIVTYFAILGYAIVHG